ncbi:hypothetical protein AB1Y20_002963 [Prymnesium parvum]|uniref:Uncharacterized protein n=1 Tax=Prymnesium parvum TaxID=97485 RepID=A0AB34JAK5_PRYPA
MREMANVDTNALDQVDSNPPGSPSEELYPDAEKYSESDGVRAAKLDEAEAEGEEKTDEEAVDQDGEVHALRDEAVLDAAAASAARGGESQLEGRHSPDGEYPAESRHDVPSPANADERRDGEGLHEDQSAGGETSAPVPTAAVQRARDELKVRKAEGKTAPLPTKTPAELRAFMKAQQAAAREQAELRGRHAAAAATRGVAGPPVAEESPRGGRKQIGAAGGTPQASPPGASPSGAVSAAEDEGLCSGTISIVERRRLERGRKASPPDIFEQRASPIPLDDRPPWQDYWPRPMPKPNEECCVSRTCLANEIALRDRQTPPSGVRAAPVVFDPTVQPVSDSAPSSPAGLVSPTQQKIVQEPRGRFVGLSPKPSPEPCTPPSRGRIASMASLSDTSATPPMLSARDSLEWV